MKFIFKCEVGISSMIAIILHFTKTFSCSPSVSMEFFDDIVIPYEYLQQPSKLYPSMTRTKFLISEAQ